MNLYPINYIRKFDLSTNADNTVWTDLVPAYDNDGWQALNLYLNLDSISGAAGGVVFGVFTQDPGTKKWVLIGETAAVTAPHGASAAPTQLRVGYQETAANNVAFARHPGARVKVAVRSATNTQVAAITGTCTMVWLP